MTRIKICGIRTLPDARAAIEAGADMLGFNFYPKSPRFVDLISCQATSSVLRRETPSIQLVGVFVNAAVDEIERARTACSLDLVQLSGDERPEVFAALAGMGFKAFHGIPRRGIRDYARASAPAFLVDAAVGGKYGGTGAIADWAGAAALARNYPLLLAGGLAPENVAQAVEQVRPWGVDVASGVESRPGQKDAGKIKAFIEAARSLEFQ